MDREPVQESRRYYQVMLTIAVLCGVAGAVALLWADVHKSLGTALFVAYPLICLSAAIFLIDRPGMKRRFKDD